MQIKLIQKIGKWFGVRKTIKKPVFITIGSFLSLSVMILINHSIASLDHTTSVLPAMGATIMLLFMSPDPPSSQARPLFLGSLLSALIGVTVNTLISFQAVSAGLAVALAIASMQTFRCMHPPAGAIALTAVIGGDSIHSLGYYYVIMPVLSNCLLLFVTASLLHFLVTHECHGDK